MFNLQKINLLVQSSVIRSVPIRLRHRMFCGIQGLSLREFSSLNANGRSLAINRKTGESRIYRAVHDKRTVPLLLQIILELLPRQSTLFISLDHSQFGPFCIAILAISFRKGRALPIWCQVNRSKAGLMKPLLNGLKKLAGELPHDQKLVLVMDRWFCGVKLFEFIATHGWYFICRAKYDRRVIVPWENKGIPIGEISHTELSIEYHKMNLRMVRSNLRLGMKEQEPWFLLTNIPSELASRTQIVHRYAERFEIEESFKDMKWFQRLEWQQIKRILVIRTLLFFIFLGWWFVWTLTLHHKELQTRAPNPKHCLSWFKSTWEAIYRLSWPDELRFTPLSP